ncbi:MAG: universal stress protein [Gemmatimonadaceae bacterium]|nr:universal stress protein [Gemmatimonadaceae bacterium]
MIAKIVVPLDGSPFAEHAIPAAVAIARRTNAALEFVSICRPPFSSPYLRGVRVYEDASLQTAVDGHRAYLAAQVARVREQDGLDCVTAVHVGPILETLLAHLAATAADLVVMTTHGGNSPNTTWLGSTTDRMIREAQVPVLLIRPATARGALSLEGTVRTILAPVDVSHAAEHVVRVAGDVAQLFDAEVLLFCAVPVGPHPLRAPLAVFRNEDVHLLEQEANAMRQQLEILADGLRSRGVRVSVRVEIHDHAATAIEEMAVSQRADLVVMATHGRGGVVRYFLGSVADKVVRSGSTAVLLIGPGAG